MVLKSLHQGVIQSDIAKIAGVATKTVYNTKIKFLEYGLVTALYNGSRPGRPIEIDERIRCKIAAISCTDPPSGHSRWTLDLIVETLSTKEGSHISRESVRLVLKDHDLKPWQQKTWCIPEINETFVERMEDILGVYERTYDKTKPVICLDEKPVHMLGNKKEPIPAKPSAPEKVDYEYIKNGQSSVFVAIEPKAGEFTTKTSTRRDGIEFAKFMKIISNKYSDAEKIVLVMDNLSTHALSSLTRTYGALAGQALWDRFEVHYTPVHASWLNQAEIAIGMLSKRCIGKRRVAEINALAGNVKSWTKWINRKKVKIKWKFTIEKARKVFKLDQ